MGSVPDAGRATFGWFGSTGPAFDLAVPGAQARAGTGMVAAEWATG